MSSDLQLLSVKYLLFNKKKKNNQIPQRSHLGIYKVTSKPQLIMSATYFKNNLTKKQSDQEKKLLLIMKWTWKRKADRKQPRTLSLFCFHEPSYFFPKEFTQTENGALVSKGLISFLNSSDTCTLQTSKHTFLALTASFML